MRHPDDVSSGVPKTKEEGVLNSKSNIPKNRRRNVLGKTGTKTRLSKLKNYFTLNMKFSNSLTQYSVYVLAVFVAYGIGSQLSSVTATNNTIKMCNQKPNECKFRYDILMYNETGRVPAPVVEVPAKK